MPYYYRFLEKFPDIFALAAASEQEVLRVWQGLGYYTRARNLHKCAKEVVLNFDGKFPDTFESLLKLPGVGDYTAAAIASFSFRESVAVVDGNVFRVLSRVFGIENEINSSEGKAVFTALANRLISKTLPDYHNQAMMEFGALHCIPKNPDCLSCCFRNGCFAAKHDLQHLFPRKGKAKIARKRYFFYLVLQKGKSLLMKKREENDIWHGLYDFLLIEKNRPVKAEKILIEAASFFNEQLVTKQIENSGSYKHVLSHQIIDATFLVIKLSKSAKSTNKNLKFYTFEKISDLPKPALISRFLSEYKNFYS
jgi:A/G-specific adenine glycosylase